MRALIVALSLLGFLVGDTAKAGLITTTREMQVSVDPAVSLQEATLETEHQLGLTKRKRRDVQRRLTAIGFDTKVNGKFDDSTRAAITRWQAARGYPVTGFLDAPQHEALLTESVSVEHANASPSDEPDNSSPAPTRGGARRHRHGVGGPVGVIGGMIGGLFGRR